MRTLTLASEQDLDSNFRQVLSEVFRLHGWTDEDELWLIRDPAGIIETESIFSRTPVHNTDYPVKEPEPGLPVVDLALGKCPDFNHRVQSVSVAETLGTAGGKTKLSWAVRRLLKPPTHPPYVWRWLYPYDDLPEIPDTLIALDIEVSGDIRVDEPEDTELLSVALAWKRHSDEAVEGVVLGKDCLEHPHWQAWLHRMVVTHDLLTHNGKFDLRWINALLGTGVTPTHDTMLLHHSMFPGAAEHGLKPLARRILGAPDWESDAKRYLKNSQAHYERIPQAKLTEYNAWDVYWTLQLFHELSRLADDDNRQAYEHELHAGEMIQPMEAYGMGVDLEYSAEVDTFYAEMRENALGGVQGFVENPNSVPQIKAAVKKNFGIQLSGTSDKDFKKALQRNPNKEGFSEFYESLMDLRTATKARSTYVTSILKKVRNGRVHPTFKIHGTTSGRLSSAGPNLQNITNSSEGTLSVRKMYVPAKGSVLVGADFSQAELRTMAELCGDPQMISDLQEDSPDFFNNLTPKIFPDVDFNEEPLSLYRRKGKVTVYGTSYGLTCISIAENLTLDGHPTSAEEAAKIQDNYLGAYPGLQDWRENTMPLVLAGDDLVTPFGRRFQQDVIINDWKNLSRTQNQAWAFRPQSIASDICLRAAMWVWDEFQSNRRYRDCHIVALVHDAIYCEVPEELGEEVLEIVQRNMRKSGAATFHRVPFLASGGIGYNWDEV